MEYKTHHTKCPWLACVLLLCIASLLSGAEQDLYRSKDSKSCWSVHFVWEMCCHPIFGEAGNAECWDGRSFTFDLCCTRDSPPPENLSLPPPSPLLSPVVRTPYASAKLGNPACWQEPLFIWDACCHPRFGETGNARCWDGRFTYRLCCISVIILDSDRVLGAGIQRNISSTPSERDRYLHLLKMAVTGSLNDEAGRCNGDRSWNFGCELSKTLPYDRELRENGRDWPPFGHTMVGHRRLENVQFVLEHIMHNDIPGDFAELGVWRGGTCIYAKAILDVNSQASRQVFLFDAFEVIPGYLMQGAAAFLAAPEADVRHNFHKYGVLDSRVHFHKGLFKDTLPQFRHENPHGQLAVLRLDSNTYESHVEALYYLYPMVVVGGFVIFDDVLNMEDVMQFWVDFKKDQRLPEDLIRIDWGGAWFQKRVAIELDLSHMGKRMNSRQVQ